MQLWTGDWSNQMGKFMNRLVRRIALISLVGGNRQCVILQRTSSENVLGKFYRNLPMGLKDTRFGGKLKHLLLRSGNIQYLDMFVERNI